MMAPRNMVRKHRKARGKKDMTLCPECLYLAFKSNSVKTAKSKAWMALSNIECSGPAVSLPEGARNDASMIISHTVTFQYILMYIFFHKFNHMHYDEK